MSLRKTVEWNQAVKEARKTFPDFKWDTHLKSGEITILTRFFCDKFGDQTSINDIREFIQCVWGGFRGLDTALESLPTYASVQQGRQAWRKRQTIERDARTHKDIPRRNMYSDARVSKAAWEFLANANNDKLNFVIEVAKRVHSVDNLLEAAKLAQKMKLYVALPA